MEKERISPKDAALTEYIKNGTFEYESNGHTFTSDT